MPTAEIQNLEDARKRVRDTVALRGIEEKSLIS